MASYGYTFQSGDGVTPTRLNDARTISEIVNADIASNAAIAGSKLADAGITAAKLNGAQSGSAPIYGCRAWVCFDGTKDTTGATSTSNTNRLITGSGNVSSVLRNAAGNYTVTFTTAMQDANYACVVVAHSGAANQIFTAGVQRISASQVQIFTADAGFVSNVSLGTAADRTASVVVFA